jgi:large subunit ribosomal protein L10
MKTKTQKQEELKNARELLKKSRLLIFADFTKISSENLRQLRRELKNLGSRFVVIKKRLLDLLLKENGIGFDARQFKSSVGAIFSEQDAEKISGPVFKFFSALEIPEGGDKNFWLNHILGGYDARNKNIIESSEIIALGQLPPREVLLGQIIGILSAPIRSFLYVLSERSKKS